jgi:integrase
MPKLFTEREIKSLKPREKEFILSEGHGFVIRVLPTGAKIWMYKYKRDGKTYKITLGNYPETSLAEARDKFAEARLMVRQGLDPKAPPPAPEPQPEATTVQALADLWLNWSKENHSPKWANTLKLALEKDILPTYGQKLAADIRRRDAIEILKAKASDTPGQARNLHKALRGIWQHGVELEYLEYNPFAEIRAVKMVPALRQMNRDRFLDNDEIKAVWNGIDAGGGTESTKRALKMILLTGQRPGEIAGIHRREIQVGIGKQWCLKCRRCGWLTIPAERMKQKKPHRVFLSQLAMSLIDPQADFAFPGKAKAPISENALAYHVRRKVVSTGKAKYYGLPRWTPHDLRRTAATKIPECTGAEPKLVEIVLGHALGGVAGKYNLYQYDPQKEQLLTAWGEYLSELVQKPEA